VVEVGWSRESQRKTREKAEKAEKAERGVFMRRGWDMVGEKGEFCVGAVSLFFVYKGGCAGAHEKRHPW
jgi:hypothetical protein